MAGIALIALLTVTGANVAPQTVEQLWEQCSTTKITRGNADSVIGACTAALQTGRLAPEGQIYAHRQRHRAHWEMDRGFDARTELEQLLTLAPRDAAAVRALGDVTYRFEKDYDGAFTLWARAKSIDPNEYSVYYADAKKDRADDHFAARRYAEAVTDYRDAIARDAFWSSDLDVNLKLARALRRLRRVDEADPILDKAARDVGNDEVLVEHALLRMSQGRYQDAIADLDRVIARSPENATTLLLRGVAQQRLNSASIRNPAYPDQPTSKWQQAEDEITRARRLDPAAEVRLWEEDLISAANFRPPGPPSDSPAPAPAAADAVASPPDATIPPDTSTFVREHIVPLWPLGAAALIGLVVLGWQVATRRKKT